MAVHTAVWHSVSYIFELLPVICYMQAR